MESKARITVIIPIYNLQKRGLDRVFWSLFSLKQQTIPVDAIVYDASTSKPDEDFNDRKTRHIRKPHKGLNIAFMMNRGIEYTKTEFIATTGADFLFKPNFFETALKHCKEGTAVFCEVDEMIRPMRMSQSFIEDWEFSKLGGLLKRNHGKGEGPKSHAPGAINLLHRNDWIKSGGYCEDFKEWGGYDNEFYAHLYHIGIKARWIQSETQCVHQWHAMEKDRHVANKVTWEANQALRQKVQKSGREPGANWLKMD